MVRQTISEAQESLEKANSAFANVMQKFEMAKQQKKEADALVAKATNNEQRNFANKTLALATQHLENIEKEILESEEELELAKVAVEVAQMQTKASGGKQEETEHTIDVEKIHSQQSQTEEKQKPETAKEKSKGNNLCIILSAVLLALFLVFILCLLYDQSGEIKKAKEEIVALKADVKKPEEVKVTPVSSVVVPSIDEIKIALKEVVEKSVAEECKKCATVKSGVVKKSYVEKKVVHQHHKHRKALVPEKLASGCEDCTPKVAEVATGENIKLWFPHEATPSNPKTCIISSGEGRGLPPYCSGFKVEPFKLGETVEEWVIRVGNLPRVEHVGIYKHP